MSSKASVISPPRPATIPLCIPNLAGNEAAYIAECIETNFVSSVGPFVDRFEREFAAHVGSPSAVASVNGTAALHIALLVAGVEPDDEVLVSTLTFIAPVNAIRYANAIPVFIDAEPVYAQMDVVKAVDFLTTRCEQRGGALRNRKSGRRVRAIVPVHILGHPVDLDPLLEAAKRFGLAVIEDATESLGAVYNGMAAGTIGDLGCFSFNGNKLITTGGGGMIVTADPEKAKRAKYLTTQAKDDPIEFIHGAIGYNYRLTNLLAALGCAQLEQVDGFLRVKQEITKRYRDAFAEIPGIALLPEAPWVKSALWLATALIDETKTGCDSRELMRRLQREGVETRPLWQPAHQSPAHRDLPRTDCPVADDLQRRALSFPSSTSLTFEQQSRAIDALRRIVGETSRAGGGR